MCRHSPRVVETIKCEGGFDFSLRKGWVARQHQRVIPDFFITASIKRPARNHARGNGNAIRSAFTRAACVINRLDFIRRQAAVVQAEFILASTVKASAERPARSKTEVEGVASLRRENAHNRLSNQDSIAINDRQSAQLVVRQCHMLPDPSSESVAWCSHLMRESSRIDKICEEIADAVARSCCVHGHPKVSTNVAEAVVPFDKRTQL